MCMIITGCWMKGNKHEHNSGNIVHSSTTTSKHQQQQQQQQQASTTTSINNNKHQQQQASINNKHQQQQQQAWKGHRNTTIERTTLTRGRQPTLGQMCLLNLILKHFQLKTDDEFRKSKEKVLVDQWSPSRSAADPDKCEPPWGELH